MTYNAQKTFDNGFVVGYNFSVSGSAASGVRAGSYGLDNTSFTWASFVTGTGPTMQQYWSVKRWYQWGCRKFWLHSPFGMPNSSSPLEATQCQPDQYLNALNGLTYNGIVSNNPCPWITKDFIQVWRALSTGQKGNLSNSVWDSWTNQSTGWFDPSDPISVTGYIGSISGSIGSRFSSYFEKNQYEAIDRLKDSYMPLIKSGMKIGIDALESMPGPIPGRHVPFSTLGEKSQIMWWNFFSWLCDQVGKKNIYVESYPRKKLYDGTYYDNPYIGCSVATDDSLYSQDYELYNHSDSELGKVNLLKSFWESPPVTRKQDGSAAKHNFLLTYENAQWNNDGDGFLDGYWYVQGVPANGYGAVCNYASYAYLLNEDYQSWDPAPERDISVPQVLVSHADLQDYSVSPGFNTALNNELFLNKFPTSARFVDYLQYTYDEKDYDPTVSSGDF